MKRRCAVLARRMMLVVASLPLLQAVGCGPEFLASALANETAAQVAGVVGTSLETILFNMFGV